jgi:hypothetical protein
VTAYVGAVDGALARGEAGWLETSKHGKEELVALLKKCPEAKDDKNKLDFMQRMYIKRQMVNHRRGGSAAAAAAAGAGAGAGAAVLSEEEEARALFLSFGAE